MVPQLSIKCQLWVNCYLPLLYLFGCIYFICWCCQEFSNTDSGHPPSAFQWVCLCMVSCFASLIIKYCTIDLMSLVEIWTGIRSLEQVLLRTIITLICTECMYLNIHFTWCTQSYPDGTEHSKHFSNIYNGGSPCSRSSVLTSLWPR